MLFTINTKNNSMVQQMKYKAGPSSISPPMTTFAFSKSYIDFRKRQSMEEERRKAEQNLTMRQVTVVPDENAPKKKSMKWGEPTWFLFHTLAEKIKESDFQAIRTELLNNIYTICANLPCPDCAAHAKSYMDGINFNVIRTKNDLKELFYTFHNMVNSKKGFPIFPRNQLEEKYSKAKTINIIQNFMHHFSDKHASIHMMANDMHRGRIVEYLKTWFNMNIHHFEL